MLWRSGRVSTKTPIPASPPDPPLLPPGHLAAESGTDTIDATLRLKVPRLAYSASGHRDLRLDFLRGFAVPAMIVDHIGGSSWLYALTGGNRFYTSAAEALVFISGLVVGIVYRGFIARDGLGPALRRVLERAAQLYLVTVGLTLIFLPASEMLALPWAQNVDYSDPVVFVVSVLTLHRTYYVVDIPLLYALLLAATPRALVLLSQGYTPLLLALSWVLWGAYQFFPEQADVPWAVAGNYAFHFSAWQALFLTAMVLGYHRARIARAAAHPALASAPRGHRRFCGPGQRLPQRRCRLALLAAARPEQPRRDRRCCRPLWEG
jgi:hypothetical protein